MGSIQVMMQVAEQAPQQASGISWATVVIAAIAALAGPFAATVTQVIANKHERAVRTSERESEELAAREEEERQTGRARDELYLEFVSSLGRVLLIPGQAWNRSRNIDRKTAWGATAHEAMEVAARVQIYGSVQAKQLARRAASQYAYLAYDIWMKEKTQDTGMSVGKEILEEILPELLELVQAESSAK